MQYFCSPMQNYLKRRRRESVMRWIMRSYHQNVASTLLTTPTSPRVLLSKPLPLGRTSLRACLKTQINQSPPLILHLDQWKLKLRVKLKSHVNKSCFMPGGLIFPTRMRNWEQMYKVCNAGFWNWKKYARKCKTRWLRCWKQDRQAKVVLDPYQGFVHDDKLQCA